MVDRIKIGSFLRELRNEKGLTQEELAEKFGVSSRSVSRWENGNTMPELGILVELADFYKVDIKEIIDGERKSESMENEAIETLKKVADYADEEKKIVIRRKSLISFGGALLAVGILAWLAWMMKTIPLVRISDQDMHVESVYRFETEEGYKYFVLYEMPNYDCPTQIEYKVEDGNTLDMIPKKSLLGRKITTESPWKNILIYSCGYESGDNGKRTLDDFDVVKFAGEMVWNKEDNLDDQVPEYVGAYDQFESSSRKIASWTIEEDYMQAEYYDGRIERWDYSGNRIY